MPYGVPPKEFAATCVMCFASMICGSMLVHIAMAPDKSTESFSAENKARSAAIAAVHKEMNVRS